MQEVKYKLLFKLTRYLVLKYFSHSLEPIRSSKRSSKIIAYKWTFKKD